MPLVSQNELIQMAIAKKVVSFPTDTVPALAVLPQYSALIFKLKKRPQDKPLILMTAEIEQFWQYVEGTEAELKIWQKMAGKYLPGALTLVLPTSKKIPPELNPNQNTIGLRVPNHPIAREILAQTGALATTSANISGELPLTSMKNIAQTFTEVFCLNSEEKKDSTTPSTVIKWTGNNWEILRQGLIKIHIPHI